MLRPSHLKALTARQIVPMMMACIGLAILFPALFGIRTTSTPPLTAARRLTFEQRVRYQRAIEEVYWRYRTWPKENPQPKPSLDKVLPLPAIAAKVQDYLAKSRTLEAISNRPITEDLLQAEVDRIVRDTKRRDMLRELWVALDNDPYVIRECLARASLANRQFGDLQNQHLAGRAGQGRLLLARLTSQPADDAFIPDPRSLHAAVWTGAEMIVWGGVSSQLGEILDNGARYDPALDAWTPTSSVGAPSARVPWNIAVWTGSEMIIWGGDDQGTGGRYNPATDTWQATSTVNVPSPRGGYSTIWTGTEMIVWGGNNQDPTFNSGARYDPATDTWRPTSLEGAPTARANHTAVWTGREMIVWGGVNFESYTLVPDGGRYDPATDSWTPTSSINQAEPRYLHAAVWTGKQMIVWGGDSNIGLAPGGSYDPATDTWSAVSTSGEPARGWSPAAVWTGAEMIIWGTSPDLTGGAYNPDTDTWRPTSGSGAPSLRRAYTVVWSGSEMIIWGGSISNVTTNDGGRYNPATDTWIPIPAPSAPGAEGSSRNRL